MKDNWIRILAAAVLCTVALLLVIGRQTKSSAPNNKSDIDTVLLTISGEVGSPGTYTIKNGSCLLDNSKSFGSFSTRANLSKIDIYKPINKDTTIKIPRKSSTKSGNYDSLYDAP